MVHAFDCNIEVALVIARDKVPLFQIPQGEIQSLWSGFEHVFDLSHREARRERLKAPAVVQDAKQSRTQGGLVAQRREKIQPAELELGLVLSDTLELVEFAAQPGVAQNFVRQVDRVKHG